MSNRFQVVLAEDEPRILQFLEKKIHSLDSRFEIVGTARNGLDALSLIEELHPQVLFSDVQMPLMNGLELVSTVRQDFPSVRCVIISGYREFDYVREAMRCEVMDYLLKPILDDDLLNVLHKLVEELERSIKNTERNAISSAVANCLDMTSFPAFFLQQRYCIMLISIGHLMNSSAQISHARIFTNIWKKINFESLLRECGLCFDDHWICDGWDVNHRFFICREEFIDPLSLSCPDILRYLTQYSNGYCVNLCLYPNALPLDCLHQGILSLQKTLQQSLIPGQSRVISFCKVQSSSVHPLVLSENQRHMLKSLISSGQTAEIKKQLDKLLLGWINDRYPQSSFENGLRQLFRLFAGASSFADENELYLVEYNILAQLSTCRSPSELIPEIWEAASHLLTRQAIEKDYARKTADDIEEYIRLHFSEDISMDSLASLLGFHAAYLNRIFKKEKHITPIQFLINLRIEKAKELITENPSWDLATIGESVGYHDPHYFSRAFKKVTGIAPSEYRILF